MAGAGGVKRTDRKKETDVRGEVEQIGRAKARKGG